MLPQLVQHPLNGLYMLFAFTLGVDEDVIEVHYHENVELFCQDLINIALECDRYVGQSKKHHLILKMAIAGPEGRVLFISFPNPHLIIGISQIKLGKSSSST